MKGSEKELRRLEEIEDRLFADFQAGFLSGQGVKTLIDLCITLYKLKKEMEEKEEDELPISKTIIRTQSGKKYVYDHSTGKFMEVEEETEKGN